MKKMCLLAHKNGFKELSETQLNFILSQTKNGKAKKIGVEENIKSTFKIFAEIFDINHQLNTSDESWQKFISALKIRHRLMHPKSPSEFHISFEDMVLIEEASSFFRESTIELVNA